MAMSEANFILPPDSGGAGAPWGGGGGVGARASTKLLRRKRSVESGAPSTILLRKMVPLPRYRGGGWWCALMRILFVGDVVGRSGRVVVYDRLPGLIRDWKLDLRSEERRVGKECR